MLHKVTRITLLIVFLTCVMLALISNLEHKLLNKAPQIHLPKRFVSQSHLSRSHSEGLNNNSWLQDRASVYKQRRDRVKAVCNNLKSIHNPKEGERFVFDKQDGIAFCMNLKVRHFV